MSPAVSKTSAAAAAAAEPAPAVVEQVEVADKSAVSTRKNDVDDAMEVDDEIPFGVDYADNDGVTYKPPLNKDAEAADARATAA